MKKQSKTINFILIAIKTEQYAIFEENYVGKDDFDILTSVGVAVYSEDKQIGVFLEIEYLQAEKVVLKIVVSCHFTINEESWLGLLDNEATNIILPRGFFGHLVEITFGAARGVLATKSEGTTFSTFILPIYDIDELIKEDGIFPIIDNNEQTT